MLLANKYTYKNQLNFKNNTTVDHIYTNILNKPCLPGVLTYDISDHLPTFCIIQDDFILRNSQRTPIRNMKNFDAISSSLQSLTVTDNQETYLNSFLTKIQDITSKHAPLRNLTQKEMKLKTKPWLTKGLLKSISIKNKLFKKCFKQKKVSLVSKYKLYLNKLTKLKQIAKKNYYSRGDWGKSGQISGFGP